MIKAGTAKSINLGSGSWIYLDIGFSNRKRSCGLAFDDDEPVCVLFSEAKRMITDHIRNEDVTCNLVIEAPLSVSFDSSGNPQGRSIEKDGSKTRYWYVGAGSAVMTAALYLVRHLQDQVPSGKILLYEGFVSYKEKSLTSDHVADVSLLREVVTNPEHFRDCIHEPGSLKVRDDCTLVNAFAVAGLSSGVPPVIARTISEKLP